MSDGDVPSAALATALADSDEPPSPPAPHFRIKEPTSKAQRRLVFDFQRAEARERFIVHEYGEGSREHKQQALRMQTALGALWNAGLLELDGPAPTITTAEPEPKETE